MLNRLTLFVIFGTLMLGLAACGELAPPPKEAEKPVVAETPKPAAVEGPYYELTKDDITSHPDWTSKNITVMGAKLGDKGVEKTLGQPAGKTNVLADEYQAFYQKNGIGVYTFKLTGKVTRIEILQAFADRIADPKLKSLVDSGDLKQMRALFGMEESMQEKPDEMGTEYIYDAKGIRFIKYKSGINGLRFGEVSKK